MTPLVGMTPVSDTQLDTTRGATSVAPAPNEAKAASFADMFANVAGEARDALRAGEAAAIAGVNGENTVQNVVRAMMTAEQQLRAAVAVRDQVVAAYQEISRMQI